MTKPLQIASNFVVISSNFDADTVGVTDTMYAELDKKYNGFAEHLLIASHTFDGDWPTQMMFVTPGEGTDNREQPVREVR